MINMMNDQIHAAMREERNRIKQAAKRMVWVTFQREGIHRYPAALEDEALAEVKYLGYEHRHIFHFKIGIEIFHNDREIEFIMFKHLCENLFSEGTLQLDYKSCEMVSDELYDHIATRYPGRDITISVSEDNENGSEIHYRQL